MATIGAKACRNVTDYEPWIQMRRLRTYSGSGSPSVGTWWSRPVTRAAAQASSRQNERPKICGAMTPIPETRDNQDAPSTKPPNATPFWPPAERTRDWPLFPSRALLWTPLGAKMQSLQHTQTSMHFSYPKKKQEMNCDESERKR